MLGEISDAINNFIGSNFLLPYTLLPTRIFKTSILIVNIFSKSTTLEKIESGNFSSTFPDHLSQFIFLKGFSSKFSAAKSNIFRHDWRKSESNKLISHFDQTDWDQFLCSKNFPMNQYLSKTDSLLATRGPLKTFNKKTRSFLRNHGLHKVFNILLKRKTIYTQNF